MGAYALPVERSSTHTHHPVLGRKLLGPALPRLALVRESAGMGWLGFAGVPSPAATARATPPVLIQGFAAVFL
jgi:hypothetical protein